MACVGPEKRHSLCTLYTRFHHVFKRFEAFSSPKLEI